ncbi:transposase, partial [Enterococcus faecium]|uniref:transposase n=1 Tax=Enterococcus faecium TaxID=1352 RepID=UPI0021CCDD0B
KVRENHRIVSKGVYIGIGIDSDGRRTILGFDVQDGESEDNWDTVFQSFVQRGLFGVKVQPHQKHNVLRCEPNCHAFLSEERGQEQ